MDNIQGENYYVTYEQESHTLFFRGALRLTGLEEYRPILALMEQALEQREGEQDFILNLQYLIFLNSSGISMFSKFVIGVRKRQDVKLRIVGSPAVPWQGKSLRNLQRLMPNLILDMVE